MNFYDLTLAPEQEAFVKSVMAGDNTIVFCNAAAGTGKSTLAIGTANMLVKDKKHYDYDGIVYIVSPYGEEKQGYLPGTQTEKSEVYFEPARQAMIECGMNPMTDVQEETMTSKKKGTGFVKLLTHTYLRGSNLSKKVVIIDEAQNFTVPELKKVLTRIHDDCKVIVIGHTGQIDISGKSGFARYIEHFDGHEHCKVCKLTVNHRGWLSSYADELVE